MAIERTGAPRRYRTARKTARARVGPRRTRQAPPDAMAAGRSFPKEPRRRGGSTGIRRERERVSMRRVWASDLAGDRHLLDGCPKCDRSETLGDGLGLVAFGAVLSPERGEDARVVGERDRALVVEPQCREGLDRVEQELLGPGELAAGRSGEHTSELQSQSNIGCRLLL